MRGGQRVVLTGCAAALVLMGHPLSDRAAADAEAYKAQCGKCHARAASIAKRLKGATPDEKAAALDTFLVQHHAPDEAVRKRIVAYLVGLS